MKAEDPACDFDVVAATYDEYSLRPPRAFVSLLIQTLGLTNSSSRCLDMGCGTGVLTIDLAENCRASIEGLDASKEMIKIAQSKSRHLDLQWHCASVEDFDFGVSKYSGLFAFEAFHLFSNPDRVIQKCTRALARRGVLAIGWCHYHWEDVLRDAIVRTFNEFGIDWGAWGYQMGDQFLSELDVSSELQLEPLRIDTVAVPTTAHSGYISKYLAHIGKAARLDAKSRERLSIQLNARFRDLGGQFTGDTRYYLAHRRKRD